METYVTANDIDIMEMITDYGVLRLVLSVTKSVGTWTEIQSIKFTIEIHLYHMIKLHTVKG